MMKEGIIAIQNGLHEGKKQGIFFYFSNKTIFDKNITKLTGPIHISKSHKLLLLI